MFGGTYSCPRCGQAYFSQEAANRCTCGGARQSKNCPSCGGSGKHISLIGPSTTCTECGGSGKVMF